jgi:glutamate N-acetyltransferase/amino-acid N-acetyltransferase
MRGAELYESADPVNGVFKPPLEFPPHERCVQISIDLGGPGKGSAVVIGADLTHEYVSENADYRS